MPWIPQILHPTSPLRPELTSFAQFQMDLPEDRPSAVKWFTRFTTLGGLTHTRESDNHVSRAIWASIFIAGCVLTIVSVHSTVSKYFDFGVNVGIKMEKNLLIPFPSVTFCNANKVHCGNLHKLIEDCSKVLFLTLLFLRPIQVV